jgi:osmotically-inducible protein OsmY
MKTFCFFAGMLLATAALAQTPDPVPATDQAAAPPAAEQRPAVPEAVENVKRALKEETQLRGKDINVSTHAETVVLTGNADSKADAARAVSTAQAAAGGLNVASQIEVKPQVQAAAAERTTPVHDVQEALKQDSRTVNLGIMVSVDERKEIGLHGLVPSRESRVAAEAVAKRASGNQRVRNYLKVPGEK